MKRTGALRFRPAEKQDFTWLPRQIWPATSIPPDLATSLPRIWTDLQGRSTQYVIEEVGSPHPTSLRSFGISVPVTGEFADQLANSPLPEGGAVNHFYRSFLAGEPIVADTAEIRRGHSAEGIDFLVLHFGAQDWASLGVPAPNLLQFGMAAFFSGHGGYRLRRLFFEAWSAGAVDLLDRSGFRPAHPHAGVPNERTPLLLVRTRESGAPLDPLTQLFHTPAPVIYYTKAEQRLLDLALHGKRDAEIAEIIQVGPDTIKKTWSAVFSRTSRHLPTLLPEEPGSGVRGPEKRSALLAYLRTHPEELRPWEPPPRQRQ